MLKIIAILFLPSTVYSANRLISEGIPATNHTIWIDTTNVRVGISTVAPSYSLHVGGGIYSTGQEIVGGTLTVQGNAFSVGAASLAVIGGNVGIGTAGPGALLHISNSGGGEMFRIEATADQTPRIRFKANGTNRFDIFGDSSRLTIDSSGGSGTTGINLASGLVGLGVVSPASKLEVKDGDIRISTTTGSRGIIFQDGTTQNTAASTSTHSVAISTDIAGTISSASGFGTCHSTLTVNFSGAPAYLVVAAMGGINGGGATSTNGLNIMVDGAYPSGLAGGTTGKGIWGCTNGGAVNAVCGISGPIHVFQPTAGSHNICLTERNSGGSFVYGGTSGNQSYAQFVWMVYEMK